MLVLSDVAYVWCCCAFALLELELHVARMVLFCYLPSLTAFDSHSQTLVITHYIGSSAESTDLGRMLKRIIGYGLLSVLLVVVELFVSCWLFVEVVAVICRFFVFVACLLLHVSVLLSLRFRCFLLLFFSPPKLF